jgi:hypothetical protein
MKTPLAARDGRSIALLWQRALMRVSGVAQFEYSR